MQRAINIKTWSLRARLLVVSLCVLFGFVLLTALALDRAFRDSADAAQHERLEALLLVMMGALDVTDNGYLDMPKLPEPRLDIPGSGFYAAVYQTDGAALWLSDSALGQNLPTDLSLSPAEHVSRIWHSADGKQTYRMVASGVRWAIGEKPLDFTFVAIAPLASDSGEVKAYRYTLWWSLAVAAGLLLCALILVQHWSLQPLRRLSHRFAALERGELTRLEGDYPHEIARLVYMLDQYLLRERATVERYRKGLGDLAHSLKTPLAILQGARDNAQLSAVVQEQTAAMNRIVQYQLQRAATAGASQLAPPLSLQPLAERLVATMAKVHAERNLDVSNTVPTALTLKMDEGDAMELLGNLLDNACKWARSQVLIGAQRSEGRVLIYIEDDGPGIAEPERLLLRGQRGDERILGHGIGLAMVQDIVLAYCGVLHIERAASGGARLEVWLSGGA